MSSRWATDAAPVADRGGVEEEDEVEDQRRAPHDARPDVGDKGRGVGDVQRADVLVARDLDVGDVAVALDERKPPAPWQRARSVVDATTACSAQWP